jgi:hypothetical protein
MARTNLPVSLLVAGGGLADPAGTAIDQANGMNVGLTTETVPPGYDAYRGLFLRVANTAASPFAVIIRAGKNPPAFRADLGDLSVTVTNGTTKWVGPLDMSIYAQSDDSLNVDFATGMTGTITAFMAPANV